MKRKKIIRYTLLTVLVLLAGAAWYIYKEYNRRHKDTARLKPDFSVQAPALISEFQADEHASNNKYWDKVIRVEGVLKEISKDDKGFYSLALGDTSSMSSVRCSMEALHNDDAAAAAKGSLVVVKGVCAGFNSDELLGSDVILVRTVIDKNKN